MWQIDVLRIIRIGNKIVLVLSAMGRHTDELISLSHEINKNVPKREMDMLLGVGEQITVSLMAMAFDKLRNSSSIFKCIPS